MWLYNTFFFSFLKIKIRFITIFILSKKTKKKSTFDNYFNFFRN